MRLRQTDFDLIHPAETSNLSVNEVTDTTNSNASTTPSNSAPLSKEHTDDPTSTWRVALAWLLAIFFIITLAAPAQTTKGTDDSFTHIFTDLLSAITFQEGIGHFRDLNIGLSDAIALTGVSMALLIAVNLRISAIRFPLQNLKQSIASDSAPTENTAATLEQKKAVQEFKEHSLIGFAVATAMVALNITFTLSEAAENRLLHPNPSSTNPTGIGAYAAILESLFHPRAGFLLLLSFFALHFSLSTVSLSRDGSIAAYIERNEKTKAQDTLNKLCSNQPWLRLADIRVTPKDRIKEVLGILAVFLASFLTLALVVIVVSVFRFIAFGDDISIPWKAALAMSVLFTAIAGIGYGLAWTERQKWAWTERQKDHLFKNRWMILLAFVALALWLLGLRTNFPMTFVTTLVILTPILWWHISFRRFRFRKFEHLNSSSWKPGVVRLRLLKRQLKLMQ